MGWNIAGCEKETGSNMLTVYLIYTTDTINLTMWANTCSNLTIKTSDQTQVTW